MGEKRRAAVIGLGPMGVTHAAITNALGHARVVAFSDSDERLIAAGKRGLPSVMFFKDYRRMIRDVSPDCVYVCTPPLTHAQVVQQVLDAGKPKAIFVEKPLATSLDEAERVCALAKERGVMGMVGFQKRFNALFSNAKVVLESGTIGRVRLFRAHDFTPGTLAPAAGWRGEPECGGAVLEWGIHLLDLVVWLLGRPKSINAYRARILSEKVEDYAYARLAYSSGVVGSLEVGWNMRNYNPPDLVIEIHGTSGVIRLDEDRMVVYGGNEAESSEGSSAPPRITHSSDVTPMPPFLLGHPENVWEEESFQRGIELGKISTNTFEDSLDVLRLSDAIRASPLN